jgi:hypothetical protein
MNQPLQERENCPSSKIRYTSEEDALYAARESMLFYNAPPLEVYFCILCMGWHRTSKINKKIRK